MWQSKRCILQYKEGVVCKKMITPFYMEIPKTEHELYWLIIGTI